MTSHLWCWSDIVDPQRVEAAMADQVRREKRKLQLAHNDSTTDESDAPPVAA